MSSQDRDNSEPCAVCTVYGLDQPGVWCAFIDNPPALIVLEVRGRTTQESSIVSHRSYGEVAAVADHGSNAAREVVVIDPETVPLVTWPKVAAN